MTLSDNPFYDFVQTLALAFSFYTLWEKVSSVMSNTVDIVIPHSQ